MPVISADALPPGPTEVYLGLGANIGNTYENIIAAFSEIKSGVLASAEISSFYVTEPQDVTEQPEFLNAACRGFFSGPAIELIEKLHHIEKNLGRKRGAESRRGPRLIDIDILLFGEYIIRYGNESDGEGLWLVIPHESLTKRRFALVPMLELNNHLINPSSGRSFSSYQEELKDQGIYSFDAVRYIKSHGGDS